MEAQTFRKKPVEIQAAQWDGTAEGASPIIDWVLTGEHAARYECVNSKGCGGDGSVGTHKPDIFAQTYEEAS